MPTGQRARARAQHGRLFPSPPKSSQTPSQTGAPWLPCEGSPVSPAWLRCGDRPGSLQSTRSFLGAGSVPVPVTETQDMMGRSPRGPGGKGVYIVCHLWPEGARGWGTEVDSPDPPGPARPGWREVLLAVLNGGLSSPTRGQPRTPGCSGSRVLGTGVSITEGAWRPVPEPGGVGEPLACIALIPVSLLSPGCSMSEFSQVCAGTMRPF